MFSMNMYGHAFSVEGEIQVPEWRSHSRWARFHCTVETFGTSGCLTIRKRSGNG